MRLKKQNNNRTIIIVIVAVVAVLALVAGGVLIYINSQKPPEMKPDDIIGIELSSRPSLTDYFVGEQFKPEGARIQVLTHDYEKSYFVDHTALSFSGFDGSKLGEQVITVTYKGFTTTFTVSVKELPPATPTLVSIRLSDNFVSTYTLDWWTEYGPVFDGVNLICTYSDGSEKSVPMSATYCLNINTNINSATTVEIPVQYIDGGIIAETTVEITVTN
ncbi:MAG: bacterial Ig-like domain-containing protein [Clostridia bacterium]|nr:bacterial Ig-like domain-containing protein [Clostridia bacterium]